MIRNWLDESAILYSNHVGCYELRQHCRNETNETVSRVILFFVPHTVFFSCSKWHYGLDRFLEVEAVSRVLFSRDLCSTTEHNLFVASPWIQYSNNQ